MNCKDFKPLVTDRGFLLVVSSQAFAGAFSAVVAVIAVKKCTNLHFHVNCKILLISLLLMYLLHSICIGGLQTLHLLRYLTYSDPCQAAIPASVCFGLRFPSVACLMAFAVLQLGMIVERAVALWMRDRYEKCGSSLGYTMVSSCVITSAAVSAWALTQMNLHTQIVYCSAGTTETAFRLKTISFGLCAVDLFTLILASGVLSLNSSAVRRKIFDLQSSYQLQENVAVFRVILPLSIFQTIVHLLFAATNAIIAVLESSFSVLTYRTLFAGTYIIPYYTMIAPLALMLLLRWSHRKRVTRLNVIAILAPNEHDVYFKGYTKMWNSSAYYKK